tara:strand:+ start:4457 stop:5287 length:831 start_codon:yes stop_codon:yes gene_type:complete
MKFRIKLSLAVAFTAYSLSLAATASAKTDGFTEALQDYYVASQKLQAQILQSAFALEKTLTQDPQVDAFKSLGETFPKAVKEYREKFEELDALSKSSGVQKKYSTVLQKIDEDDNEKSLPVLADFSEAIGEFSDSLERQHFTVYAQEEWANSGIRVEQDDFIWVNSEGSWQASPSYSGANSAGYVCRSDSAYAINRSAPLGALLYRVRGSANVNGMGLDKDLRGKADAAGRLEFIMNDDDRRNNTGQLSLTVVVMDQEDLRSMLKVFNELRELSKE